MNTICIVVVGHVDHGKTSLVHALTGMETDRLPEEKARGLSIAAGFAHKTYPMGTIDFIDAPGHEDFVQAMVAGATGAQAVLAVISATEGKQAQTYEHLAIAETLGIDHVVIAVTKSDLLDPAEGMARLSDLRQGVAGISLASPPITLCSAMSGEGLAELDTTFQNLLTRYRPPKRLTTPMLPVDRVFSIAGRGTIATGTLLGGGLTADTEMVIQPSGRYATIRTVQSRGIQRDEVYAGERVAVNLRGVAVGDIARGDVLSVTSAARPTHYVDVRISLLGTSARPLKHMDKVRVHFGTTHQPATVRLYGAGAIGPAQKGYAQLRFEKPVFGYEGQRAVLRSLSPPATIGGAEFLDTQAVGTRAGDHKRLDLLRSVDERAPLAIGLALCRADGGTTRLQDVARLSQLDINTVRTDVQGKFENLSTDVIAASEYISSTSAAILDALAAYHAGFPLRMIAPRAVMELARVAPALVAHCITTLSQTGQIRLDENGVALAGHDPVATLSLAQRKDIAAIEGLFRDAGVISPRPSGAEHNPDLMALLIDTGHIIPLQNISLNQTLLFHVDCLTGAAQRLRDSFGTSGFTTSQARNALETSRKIIVPVLEYFDNNAVTVREGDIRKMTIQIPVPPQV